MKAAAQILMALLFWQAAPANEPPVAQPDHMRYVRALSVPAGAGQACAVLDAQVFPHAEPALIDLRIFPRGAANGAQHEVPYAITMSEAVTEETQPARLLNLGSGSGGGEGGKIVFDLEMPQRAYSEVALDIDPNATNFLATATVTGMDALGSKGKSTALGSFTLFDLTAQHLSRSTTLPLQESTFHYLHVALSVSPAPGTAPGAGPVIVPAMVLGAEVPPSRESEILYTTVAATTSVETAGRQSRASFQIPARVPVERVEFALAPGFKANFSRDVKLAATAESQPKGSANKAAEAEIDNDQRAPLPETVTGNILRVHANEAGREIHTEELGFPAILGANLQRPAKVEVDIENGDDQPLPIREVRLEMRQRELCFDRNPPTHAPVLALYYGDPALAAPVYDYERLFVAADKPLVATLGPEQLNPQFTPRPQPPQPFTERHPQVLWIALIAAICALGLVAIRSSRNLGHSMDE
jgi:hypothetical protein